MSQSAASNASRPTSRASIRHNARRKRGKGNPLHKLIVKQHDKAAADIIDACGEEIDDLEQKLRKQARVIADASKNVKRLNAKRQQAEEKRRMEQRNLDEFTRDLITPIRDSFISPMRPLKSGGQRPAPDFPEECYKFVRVMMLEDSGLSEEEIEDLDNLEYTLKYDLGFFVARRVLPKNVGSPGNTPRVSGSGTAETCPLEQNDQTTEEIRPAHSSSPPSSGSPQGTNQKRTASQADMATTSSPEDNIPKKPQTDRRVMKARGPRGTTAGMARGTAGIPEDLRPSQKMLRDIGYLRSQEEEPLHIVLYYGTGTDLADSYILELFNALRHWYLFKDGDLISERLKDPVEIIFISDSLRPATAIPISKGLTCVAIDNIRITASDSLQELEEGDTFISNVTLEFAKLALLQQNGHPIENSRTVQDLVKGLLDERPHNRTHTPREDVPHSSKRICQLKTKRQTENRTAIFPIPVMDDTNDGYNEVNILNVRWQNADDETIECFEPRELLSLSHLCPCSKDLYTHEFLRDYVKFYRDNEATQLDFEKERLREILERVFFFNYHEWQIPYDLAHEDDIQSMTEQKMSDFVSEHGQNAGNLLIISYAGHGRFSPPQKTGNEVNSTFGWYPYGPHRKIDWTPIQQRILKTSQSDVLFLLDCCNSGGANMTMDRVVDHFGGRKTRKPGRKAEVIGAVSRTATTPALGKDTFFLRILSILQNEMSIPGSMTGDLLNTKLGHDQRASEDPFRCDLGMQRKGISTITLDPCYASLKKRVKQWYEGEPLTTDSVLVAIISHSRGRAADLKDDIFSFICFKGRSIKWIIEQYFHVFQEFYPNYVEDDLTLDKLSFKNSGQTFRATDANGIPIYICDLPSAALSDGIVIFDCFLNGNKTARFHMDEEPKLSNPPERPENLMAKTEMFKLMTKEQKACRDPKCHCKMHQPCNWHFPFHTPDIMQGNFGARPVTGPRTRPRIASGNTNFGAPLENSPLTSQPPASSTQPEGSKQEPDKQISSPNRLLLEVTLRWIKLCAVLLRWIKLCVVLCVVLLCVLLFMAYKLSGKARIVEASWSQLNHMNETIWELDRSAYAPLEITTVTVYTAYTPETVTDGIANATIGKIAPLAESKLPMVLTDTVPLAPSVAPTVPDKAAAPLTASSASASPTPLASEVPKFDIIGFAGHASLLALLKEAIMNAIMELSDWVGWFL